MDDLLGFLLQALADGFGGDWLAVRRIRRLRRRSRVDCALRVTQGAVPGLRDSWRNGTARLGPGSIAFKPKRPGAKEIALLVHSVSEYERWPAGTAIRAVGPRTRIAALQTETATLDWAVAADQLDWALQLVASPQG